MRSLFPPDGNDYGNNATPGTDNLLILVYVKKIITWLLRAGQNAIVDPKAA